ncbi:MAG TPA: TetR/AcrR family transcriptional regulator [Longimicrobium sp.]|uniref:TetR/AcrR family transcriptional regulator n=1 Tax=Longimicrobium sp. TaxID=2029185 RepID=UPI002EDA5F48
MNGEGGRRERNKQLKLARIREAAAALFAERGFEGTTMRELAERADVATGTLFLYVADKRELLFLHFTDRLSGVVERSLAGLPGAESPVVERLAACFAPLFAFYAHDPELARHFVREQVFSSGGVWEARAHELSRRFLGDIAQLLDEARVAGQVDGTVDLGQAAANVFALYFLSLVGWLGGHFTAGQAQASLRAGLDLQIRGLATPPRG